MYKAIVIGASAGGMEALGQILSGIRKKSIPPIIIAQHISANSDNYMVKYLSQRTMLSVKEAENHEIILVGNVYIAPPNYHLLVEKNLTLSLSVEKKVLYSRPSIDVLFTTAAEAMTDELVGIVLTGSNSDGSNGLYRIKELGGYTIVQNPETAESKAMPKYALEKVGPDKVLTLKEIVDWINEL